MSIVDAFHQSVRRVCWGGFKRVIVDRQQTANNNNSNKVKSYFLAAVAGRA